VNGGIRTATHDMPEAASSSSTRRLARIIRTTSSSGVSGTLA
jgi:hypothetical protein